MRLTGLDWRLQEVMAASDVFSTATLSSVLKERGVLLPVSQLDRLVSEKPERVNMKLIVALLEIFDCTLEDLAPRVTLAEPAPTSSPDASIKDT